MLLKIDSVCRGNSLFPQATGQVYSLACSLTAISSSSSPFLSAAAGPSVLLSRISCSQVQPSCREAQPMPTCPDHQAPFTVALKTSPKPFPVFCSCNVQPCHVGPSGLQSSGQADLESSQSMKKVNFVLWDLCMASNLFRSKQRTPALSDTFKKLNNTNFGRQIIQYLMPFFSSNPGDI